MSTNVKSSVPCVTISINQQHFGPINKPSQCCGFKFAYILEPHTLRLDHLLFSLWGIVRFGLIAVLPPCGHGSFYSCQSFRLLS